MVRIPLLAVVALLLAGCASGVMDRDDGRWLVTHKAGETDYEMGDRVLFAVDSARISPRAYDLIATVATEARRNARAQIEVQGFTDTSGTHDYNMTLSQARAERVADILVRHGIKAERIMARGYGEERLAVRTGNGVKEARNRRVVIRILDARNS